MRYSALFCLALGVAACDRSEPLAPVSMPRASEAAISAAPVQEGWLTGADGVRLRFQVVGSGPDTVVVLHGGPVLFSSSYLVKDFAPLVAGRTLIFFDQRGAGRSELPADTTLHTAGRIVADLEAVRQHFGIERMSLLGQSWGAMLAGLYAMEHPQRVERMVLANPAPIDVPAQIEFLQNRAAKTTAAETARQDSLFPLLFGGPDPVGACEAYFGSLVKSYMADNAALANFRGTWCDVSRSAPRRCGSRSAGWSPRWATGTSASRSAPWTSDAGDPRLGGPDPALQLAGLGFVGPRRAAGGDRRHGALPLAGEPGRLLRGREPLPAPQLPPGELSPTDGTQDERKGEAAAAAFPFAFRRPGPSPPGPLSQCWERGSTTRQCRATGSPPPARGRVAALRPPGGGPRTPAQPPREGCEREAARPAAVCGARLRYAALFAALRSRSPTPAQPGARPNLPSAPTSLAVCGSPAKMQGYTGHVVPRSIPLENVHATSSVCRRRPPRARDLRVRGRGDRGDPRAGARRRAGRDRPAAGPPPPRP